ncbi:isopropanol dehydrogenase [Mollisia scopiformis]|uniref:Isopropanol dehydrogenase n=1 Tax=Mollisia scopiformis TaxID=149040 RepID=A0A194X3H9_MOLSC|nr:isopropanol dehydrogenase [Mollisia scopiformis]KUJ14584.1 isopropanol dehydrogenase [Mollisia scopiformis]
MANTHKALVLHSTSSPLSLETWPIPAATPGSVIVKVLGTTILPYLKDILNGTLQYTITFPMIPGSNCVARVHSVGADSISLKEGQLVLCDITVRARDDPNKAILMGLHGGAAMKLMEGEWRHGSYAEFAKFPLENVFPLNEEVVCRKLEYTIKDLCSIPGYLVPYGGFSEINLLPGDTVIVAPATGRFGGGAVTMALTMGATVIACGRNESTLSTMSSVFEETGRLKTHILTGDVEKDTANLTKLANNGQGADAYIDFSPASAAKSTHIQSCMAALRPKGKAVFMGGIYGKVEIDYNLVMMKSLRIQGRFMYERDMVVQAIKLIENGNLKLGEKVGSKTLKMFGLEDIEEGLLMAGKEAGWGKQVVLMP